MLAGVIGGAGRFLGGFFGGLVGGTASGVMFPYLFVQMRQIVESIERIVNRLGLDVASDDGKKEPGSDGPSIMVQLRSLSEVLREVGVRVPRGGARRAGCGSGGHELGAHATSTSCAASRTSSTG